MTSSPSSRKPRPEDRLGAGLLLTLALAGSSLQAEIVNVGAQLTLAKPVMDLEGGDWVKGRFAQGFGLRIPHYFEGAHAFTPRVDLLNVRSGPVNVLLKDNSVHLYTERAKVQILSVAMDYAYHFSGRPEEGPYAGIGLGVSRAKFHDGELMPGGAGGPLPSGTTWATNQTRAAIQGALLTGWQISDHLGLEFRFTQSNYKGIGIPGTIVKTPIFALSLTVEF